jgi:hypothetical protein
MVCKPRFALLAALCLALALPAAAQEVEFEITPSAGFRFFGAFEDPVTRENADIEESTSFAIAADMKYRADKAVQLFYSRQATEIEELSTVLDLDVEYFQIGGVAEFPLEGDLFTPYAVGTVGAARYSPGGGFDDETAFALSLGGGWKYYFSDHFGVRLEARGYLTFFNSDTDLFCSSIQGVGTCLLRASGSAVWQIEAMAGVTFKF